MKLFVSVILTFTMIVSLVVWFFLPQSTSNFLLSLNNASAGLSAKVVDTEIGDIHYLEGGNGETIVLVHGIYARKEHWVDLARELTSDFRVIALDLPGFGDNKSLSPELYGLEIQAKHLSSVLDALGIRSAHFGSNSMGAQIAGILANKRPELMKSLAFIGSPLGVPTEIMSDMDKSMERSQFPLVVKTESDFNQRNDWLFPKVPFLPGPIMKTWMQQELADPDKNEQIWHAVHNFSNVPKLLNIAPSLNLDTLIIWCNKDRIFDVSGASLLDNALPNSRATILEDCGHVPMLDKPKEVSEAYLSFLNEISIKNSSFGEAGE